MTAMSHAHSRTRQRAAFEHLLARFDASTAESTPRRWRYLEAAHVLAQNRYSFLLHWRAHWRMLQFARTLKDDYEVRGQLGHLLMTPISHLVRFVPPGNTGRAVMPAMQPMVPSPQVRECIAEAMAATDPAAPATSAHPGPT